MKEKGPYGWNGDFLLIIINKLYSLRGVGIDGEKDVESELISVDDDDEIENVDEEELDSVSEVSLDEVEFVESEVNVVVLGDAS